MTRGLFAGVACLALAGSFAFADDAATAKQALDAAGVRQGLCLVLGAGREASAGFAAALAADSDRLLVRAVALDDASLGRVRAAVDAKGLSGRAMAEKLPLKPLPFLNDLADIVFIEDFDALSAQGLTMAEVERVTAPLGVICIQKAGVPARQSLGGGGWTKSVKPRPAGMDEWTHPNHGADGNIVSTDTVFHAPVGLRWMGGFPFNASGFAANRAYISAGGRCYTWGINEYENVNTKPGKAGHEQYLAARDAWNGMSLWKIDVGVRDEGIGIMWENAGPLCADDRKAYATVGEKVLGVDGASGKVEVTFDTKYQAWRLARAEGLLVAASWEKRAKPKESWLWMPVADTGAVQAFDAETGKEKWSVPLAAFQMLVADGVVYLVVPKGNPLTEQVVVALDLATGHERWRVPNTAFGPEPDVLLTVAGKGFVVASKPKEKMTFALAAADGHKLWDAKSGTNFTPIVDGLLWLGGKRDPLTGEDKGKMPGYIGGHGCQAVSLVGSRYAMSIYGIRELTGVDGAKPVGYPPPAARSSCVEGYVTANGMIYCSQNNCKCMPGAVYGFLALGPPGDAPNQEDFARARPVEQGPAYGVSPAGVAEADSDWPTWRGNAERSASVKTTLPGTLKLLWKTQAAREAQGQVALAWKDRLDSLVSAPVVSKGVVYASATESGQVVALECSKGKVLWTTTLGSRLDTPPTVAGGVCYVGCRDGWVYALRATDGALVWRTRAAPWERRMVAFSQVESVWPAIGAVLVHDGTVYGTAGRSTEVDGGIALVSLDAATGVTKWGAAIGTGTLRMNDALSWREGALGWRYMTLDPASGKRTAPEVLPTAKDYGGGKGYLEGAMVDGTWTLSSNRRSGNAFRTGKVPANIAAWNDEISASSIAAYSAKDFSELWKVPYGRATPVDAMALASNALVVSGHQRGEKGLTGYIGVLSLADGKRIATFDLDAAPTYDGVAVAGGCIYVSLQDGAILCFGKGE